MLSVRRSLETLVRHDEQWRLERGLSGVSVRSEGHARERPWAGDRGATLRPLIR